MKMNEQLQMLPLSPSGSKSNTTTQYIKWDIKT